MLKSSDNPDGAQYAPYAPTQTYSLPKMKSNASTMPEDLKTMSLKELSLKAPKSTDKDNKGPSPLGNKKLNSHSMPQGLDSTGNTVSAEVAGTCIGSLDDLSREPLSDSEDEDEMVL